jgi:hypothetical protein
MSFIHPKFIDIMLPACAWLDQVWFDSHNVGSLYKSKYCTIKIVPTQYVFILAHLKELNLHCKPKCPSKI